MREVTYSTRLPLELTDFCEAYPPQPPQGGIGELYNQVERRLYKALLRGESLNKLKQEYQLKFGINARHFNSIKVSIQGKIRSRNECYQRQIAELTERIDGLEKAIDNRRKKLDLTHLDQRVKKVGASCSLKKGKRTPRQNLKFELHQKNRKLVRLKAKLNQLKSEKPQITFGSKKLFKAQFNREANGYKSHQEWLLDWRKARNGSFVLVGSSDEKAGNQNCQLTPTGELAITIPVALLPEFKSHPNFKKVQGSSRLVVEGVKFLYGQSNINYALMKGQPITFRFSRKQDKWYINCTVSLTEVPYQSQKSQGYIGIDLNPGVIGWAYINREGNLLEKGQIRINLKDRTSHQVKATLGDAVRDLVILARERGCPIVIERLDFTKKKATMKEQGVKYSRMLSNFAYSKFEGLLTSHAAKWGIEVIKLNPAYSSLIGLTKFLRRYGLSSDTAAALVLARRALRCSERIPANYAFVLHGDKTKHVWSFWNKLNKKLKGVKRHRFFSVANSGAVATLLDELKEKSSNRSSRKRRKKRCTSVPG
jgi:IS605 OrfB family transposase